MEFLIVFAIIVGAFLLFQWMKSTPKGYKPTESAPARPPTGSGRISPLRMRRRRRGGGFYPVDYDGEYYDDEELVDDLLFAAEIAAFEALDEVVELSDQAAATSDAMVEDVVEERKSSFEVDGSWDDPGDSNDSYDGGSDDSGSDD